MKTAPYIIALAAAAIAAVGLIWLTEIPLGIPGEWTWARITPPPDAGLTLLFVGIVGAIFLVFLRWGYIRIATCRGWETGLWLCGLTLAGFGWLWIVQDAAPPGYQFSKIAWVLYYPGASGYFTQARDHDDNFDQFLADYEELMAEGDVLHVGTHPPGLTIGYHWLIAACRASPTLTAALRATEPESLAEALDIVTQNHAGATQQLLPEHRAAIWLAALLTQLAAATTVIPLFLLIRRDVGAPAAWLTTALWPAVPAVALFLPKSDVLYPCVGMAIWYFWLTGWEDRSVWRAFVAGLLTLVGLCMSLALIPVLVALGCLTLWRGWFCRPEDRVAAAWPKLWYAKVWSASGFVIPAVLFWLVSGVNLLSVWVWNYRNHAGFYDQYPRTYWKWLLVNPLEFALAAGTPLAVAALVGGWNFAARAPRTRQAGLVWSCLAVWGLLWISGKNMGELARLWILMMPWLVWIAAGSFLKRDTETRPDVRRWVGLLIFQAAVGVAMTMRVHGFHIPDAPAEAATAERSPQTKQSPQMVLAARRAPGG